MVTRKKKAAAPIEAGEPVKLNEAGDALPAVDQVAADIAAVDGVESVTVADGDDAPVVVAEVEPDLPRWMKYRIEQGLPIDDAPAGDV